MLLGPTQVETDTQSYLVKRSASFDDIVLEGQLAARSALRKKSPNSSTGVLAFILPTQRSFAPGDSGAPRSDRLIVEPDPDFTRSWVHSLHQQQDMGPVAERTVPSNYGNFSTYASLPQFDTPEALLSQPNVRGIHVENARPTQLGLELLWFLRSLTNGDVKRISSTLEQTVW